MMTPAVIITRKYEPHDWIYLYEAGKWYCSKCGNWCEQTAPMIHGCEKQ